MAYKAVRGIARQEVSQNTADMLVLPLRWAVRRKGAEEMEDRRAGWLRRRGSLTVRWGIHRLPVGSSCGLQPSVGFLV